jgi:hypothetical protein
LEVKDLNSDPPTAGFSFFDPVKPIRDHINEAQKQFKEFAGFPCLIGLYNVSTLTYLDDPTTVFGAMHGPIELRFRYDPEVGRLAEGPPEQVFSGKRAKMRSTQDDEKPKNRRISALVCLRTVEIGSKRASRYFMQFFSQQWGDHVGDDVPFEPEEVRLRVVVYENMDALSLLPDDLFRGKFDVRWRFVEAEVRRVFVGAGLEEFERLEEEVREAARQKFPKRN